MDKSKQLALASIDFHYTKACDIASKLVESEARKLMLKHPNLEEFCMGMGTWHFKIGRSVTIHTRHYDAGSLVDETDFAYLKPFAKIFDDWNSVLKITGEGMRFTATGPKITNW